MVIASIRKPIGRANNFFPVQNHQTYPKIPQAKVYHAWPPVLDFVGPGSPTTMRAVSQEVLYIGREKVGEKSVLLEDQKHVECG